VNVTDYQEIIIFYFNDFVVLTYTYKKQLPEDDVNTSKHVGAISNYVTTQPT
jgi:hypothetical protein